MRPFNLRTPDTQYADRIRYILEHGEMDKETPQGVGALTVFGELPSMSFDLGENGNGFPMITERSIKGFWKQSVGEIFAFINGARTQKDLESFGCYFWKPWLNDKKKTSKRGLEDGDNGPGSYGAAFHDFPTPEGERFNQFAYILRQIKERPELRTHFISPWIPQYTIRVEGRTQRVVVCPCHGWIHIRIINGRLNLHLFQRSADMPVGVPSNMVQYAALTLALAQITGYQPGKFIHSFSDAHIYEDQIPNMKEILRRAEEPKPLPTVRITDLTMRDLFAFRSDHFELSDYSAYPAMKDIPVAV